MFFGYDPDALRMEQSLSGFEEEMGGIWCIRIPGSLASLEGRSVRGGFSKRGRSAFNSQACLLVEAPLEVMIDAQTGSWVKDSSS